MKRAAGLLLALALLTPVRAIAGEPGTASDAAANARIGGQSKGYAGEIALKTQVDAKAKPDTLWNTSPAKAYCLIDRESGRVLLAYNEDEPLPMASTTKIMTALLAVERCAMDESVTAGKNAAGVPGTSIYLSEGETLSMRQMLLGLMLRSGNDAAVAIAEHIAGSVPDFTALMNEKASLLGIDARFETPNGLDAPGHAASALAMCRLAAAALENPLFREIVSTKSAVIPWEASQYDRALTNKNRLLKSYAGATGVKTGYTSKAGRCLVFSARREGMELVGAALNCYTWFDSAEELLDAGFERFDLATALTAGQEAGEVRVSGGAKSAIRAVAASDLKAPVGVGENWRLSVDLTEGVTAPIEKGQRLGEARIVSEETGETLSKSELVAGEEIARYSLWTAIREFFRRILP